MIKKNYISLDYLVNFENEIKTAYEKGKIDATPITSNKAIIMIIVNNNPASFNSLEVSKSNKFLKVCIKL